jgi:hypothetical protein
VNQQELLAAFHQVFLVEAMGPGLSQAIAFECLQTGAGLAQLSQLAVPNGDFAGRREMKRESDQGRIIANRL